MPKLKSSPKNGKLNQPKAAAGGQPYRDVDFVLECAGAENVYICGDFNQWQPTSLRVIGHPDAGLWGKRLALPPGRHEYKFVVDGKWLPDPDASENVPNAFGSLNSVLEVRS